MGQSTSVAQNCTQLSVTFNEYEATQPGQNVSLVGSIPELGDWNLTQAVPLANDSYTDASPQWSASVNLPLNITFQYKYIKINTDGSITWEADPNHQYTTPNTCQDSPVLSNTWQSTTPTTAAPTYASTVAASTPTAVCTNGPTTRKCWWNGFDYNTDFDNNWPNTGNTVSYNWTITNMTLSPDGVPRQVFAVNGQTPGPTLYANWGDMISVTINNQMEQNGTSIHWHGLRQYHRNTQDGVPGVTECPIAPGQSKTYNFQATQYGTSWYHSHFSSQYGDGIVGPIVIFGPATANYDIDLGPLPFSDWYYETITEHAAAVAHTNALPPTADTGLINGSMVSSSGGSYSSTTLTAGKKHLLRLINVSVDNHFMVSLDNHPFLVITSDFVPIVPYNATWIFLGIGQRYDVIISADQDPASYWFRAEVQDQAGCGANANNGNIKSIFAYSGHEGETPGTSATTYTQRCSDETTLVPHWNSYIPPQSNTADPTLLGTSLNQSHGADGSLTLYWQVNGSALNVQWDKPTLEYVKTGNTSYPYNANVIQLPSEGVWTYWVIQEVDGAPSVWVPHPLHLHGHDYYVLGTGTGTFSVAANNATLNYNNPTRRDTAMLPPLGWIVLAFQTDNPGAWIFHCHITWHADEGLAVQFLEAPDQIQSVDPIGDDFDAQCATWDQYYPSGAAFAKDDSGI